jgi:hypothetical protein
VTQRLAETDGPVVAVSDYLRAVQDQIRPFVPGDFMSLGTDGWGLSDTRGALRRHFLVDAEAITAIHGPPERILPCGDTPIWVFPPDWQPMNWLIAMADPLVPEALAIGRQVCIAPARVSAEGLVLDLPPGAFRIALTGEARLRLSDAHSGKPLGEVAPLAEITLSHATRLRISPVDAAALQSLVIAPARPAAIPASC